MLVAQLTDLHIAEDGGFMRRFVDANAKLEMALEFLERLHRRPNAVVVTGDVANDGRPDQYRLLRQLLARTDMAVYIVPGNHDEREAFRRAFADQPWMPPAGPIDYVIDDHPLRLIGLDTSEDGRHDGELQAEQLQWLDQVLAQAPDRPTMLFMHHPPFLTRLWMFDQIRLTGAEELRRVVARHPQVVQIVAGHVHRPISSNWGATVLTTSPSTAHQSRCDLEADEGAGVVDETPMLQLHLWQDRTMVTHTIPFEAPAQTIEISAMVGDWPAARQRILAGPPFPKGPGGFF